MEKVWIKTSTTKTVVNFYSSCTEQTAEVERVGFVDLPFSPAHVCHTNSACVPFELESSLHMLVLLAQLNYNMDALSPDS